MELRIRTAGQSRMPEPHEAPGVAARADDQRPLTRAEFTAVVERHDREVLAFLRSLVGDAEHARDLLQDTFYDAWRAAKRGAAPLVAPVSQPDVRRWLFHAAYCRAISARRRGRLIRWESLDDPTRDEVPLTGQLAAFEDQVAEAEVVSAALQQLAPEDAACLLLTVVQGFTATEAAEIMGASSAAVAKRVSRAKRRLLTAYLAQNAEHGKGEPA